MTKKRPLGNVASQIVSDVALGLDANADVLSAAFDALMTTDEPKAKAALNQTLWRLTRNNAAAVSILNDLATGNLDRAAERAQEFARTAGKVSK